MLDEFDDAVRGVAAGIVVNLENLLLKVVSHKIAINFVLVVLGGKRVFPEYHFVEDYT